MIKYYGYDFKEGVYKYGINYKFYGFFMVVIGGIFFCCCVCIFISCCGEICSFVLWCYIYFYDSMDKNDIIFIILVI